MTVIARREMQQGLSGLCRVAPRTTPSNDRFHAQRTRTDGQAGTRKSHEASDSILMGSSGREDPGAQRPDLRITTAGYSAPIRTPSPAASSRSASRWHSSTVFWLSGGSCSLVAHDRSFLRNVMRFSFSWNSFSEFGVSVGVVTVARFTVCHITFVDKRTMKDCGLPRRNSKNCHGSFTAWKRQKDTRVILEHLM
jgi:hypothetical protein